MRLQLAFKEYVQFVTVLHYETSLQFNQQSFWKVVLHTFRFICVGSVRQPNPTKRQKNWHDWSNTLFQKISLSLPWKALLFAPPTQPPWNYTLALSFPLKILAFETSPAPWYNVGTFSETTQWEFITCKIEKIYTYKNTSSRLWRSCHR